MSADDSTKACSRCLAVLPLSRFYKKSSSASGVRSECKDCTKADYESKAEGILANKRQRYSEKRDEIIAYQKAYREANAERVRREALERHRRNRDGNVRRMRAYRSANLDRLRMVEKAWRAKNADLVRERDRNKRAKRAAASGRHTAADVRALLRLQRGQCAACRKRLFGKFHVDHIRPLSRGGSNDRLNLQLLCPRCNLSKSARDPVEFMQSMGFLL